LLHDDDGDDALRDAAADGVPTGDAASSGCAAPARCGAISSPTACQPGL